jgi:hypothetical protein
VKLNGKVDRLDAGALAGLAGASAPTGQAAPACPRAAEPEEKPAAKPAPPLKTSGSLAFGEIDHPNLKAGASEVRWALDGITPTLESMSGTATLRVGPGKTTNLLALAQQKAGKVLLAPLIAIDKARGMIPGVALPDVNNLPFTRITGDYVFRNGVMTMQPSLFDGPTLMARTDGQVDMVKQTLDLKVAMSVAGVQPMLKVTGSTNDPKVAPDIGSMIPNSTKQELQNQLQQQGEKLLKGIFGH